MSDSWPRHVPEAAEKGLEGHINSTVTKSAMSPAQPSHSRNSSWNIHGGLFNELDEFPSVSMNNQSNSVTSDDVVSAHCFRGSTSPVRRPAQENGNDGAVSHRRSVTPQKTGVRGVAMRLASCEKEVGQRPLGDVGRDPLQSVQSVQMDSAPRTSYTGILKKLEFRSGGYTSEDVQNTKLIFTRLKETLEERRTPVGARTKSAMVHHRTPVGHGVRETATKKLTFTTTRSGEGAGSWEHGAGNPLVTMPSSTRYRGSARRVTFGRVSLDEKLRQPIMEEGHENDHENDHETGWEEGHGVGSVGSDGFSFQTMTCSAGSTPYSGKAFGERRGRVAETPQVDCQKMITKDQLASALKKSLNFASADDEGAASVEKQFSFGWDGRQHIGPEKSDQASTPGFKTFKAFKPLQTKGGRFLTPPSKSPRLLELHGKARRVSGAGMVVDVEAEMDVDDNDENTPVGADAADSSDSKSSKLSKFSLPRRLDVTEKGTSARPGTKHTQLSSPTELGIRNSLKMERTKRLSSASKFNSTSPRP